MTKNEGNFCFHFLPNITCTFFPAYFLWFWLIGMKIMKSILPPSLSVSKVEKRTLDGAKSTWNLKVADNWAQ